MPVSVTYVHSAPVPPAMSRHGLVTAPGSAASDSSNGYIIKPRTTGQRCNRCRQGKIAGFSWQADRGRAASSNGKSPGCPVRANVSTLKQIMLQGCVQCNSRCFHFLSTLAALIVFFVAQRVLFSNRPTREAVSEPWLTVADPQRRYRSQVKFCASVVSISR